MRRARLELAVEICRLPCAFGTRSAGAHERNGHPVADLPPVNHTPSAAMRPASSCPATCGRAIPGSWPCQVCQSLRQTPVASTSITTPSGAGSGSGASRTSGRTPNSLKMTALTLVRVAIASLRTQQNPRPQRACRGPSTYCAAVPTTVACTCGIPVDKPKPEVAHRFSRPPSCGFPAGQAPSRNGGYLSVASRNA